MTPLLASMVRKIGWMKWKYSAYHEVECDGVRRHYLEITIKTPSGKVKYNQKIY